MKYVVAACLLFPILSLAQTNKTSKERPEEIQKIIDDNQERFVFELTHDRASGDQAPDIATLSRGFNVYYTKNIPLGDSKFSVAPGFGVANRNMYMRDVFDFDPATNTTSIFPTPAGLDRNSSKLSFTYLEVPVELRWNSTPNKRGHSVKVATGFRAGYAISTRYKYNGEVFDGNRFANDSGTDIIYSEKFKIKKLNNTINYRVAPSFRVGYGSVNLFGYYHLNQDFESNNGPDYNGYSIGLSISSF